MNKEIIGRDKDEATKEAIALLDKEYEIFNPSDMPSTKVLTRFDTWDEDKTVDQWLEECLEKPGQAHALSPVYQGYEYCWKPVEVYGWDSAQKNKQPPHKKYNNVVFAIDRELRGSLDIWGKMFF